MHTNRESCRCIGTCAINPPLSKRLLFCFAGDRFSARENDLLDVLFHIKNPGSAWQKDGSHKIRTIGQSTYRVSWLLNIAARKGKEVYLMTCSYHCSALVSTHVRGTCMLCWSASKFSHGRTFVLFSTLLICVNAKLRSWKIRLIITIRENF
jgi:hypothetical protein